MYLGPSSEERCEAESEDRTPCSWTSTSLPLQGIQSETKRPKEKKIMKMNK
jgi:hypothetical protein